MCMESATLPADAKDLFCRFGKRVGALQLLQKTKFCHPTQLSILDQTWIGHSLDDPLKKVCLMTLPDIQDGHKGF